MNAIMESRLKKIVGLVSTPLLEKMPDGIVACMVPFRAIFF